MRLDTSAHVCCECACESLLLRGVSATSTSTHARAQRAATLDAGAQNAGHSGQQEDLLQRLCSAQLSALLRLRPTCSALTSSSDALTHATGNTSRTSRRVPDEVLRLSSQRRGAAAVGLTQSPAPNAARPVRSSSRGLHGASRSRRSHCNTAAPRRRAPAGERCTRGKVERLQRLSNSLSRPAHTLPTALARCRPSCRWCCC